MAPKFRLDPEALQVESFETERLKDGKGTVFGHDSYPLSQSTCHEILCGCTYPGGTCDLSCMGDPCQPTNVNCNGCGGGSGNTCGCQNSLEDTCATGRQIQCSCNW
jgi:hypothetical protein